MPFFTRLLVAATLLMAAVSASADSRSTAINDPGRAARVSAEQAAHRAQAANRSGTQADAKSTNAIASTEPAQPIANPYRAYPPSCLADPLPDQPSGPLYQNSNVNLAAYDVTTGNFVLEAVTITLWRIPCSSSSLTTSVTLMRIQRRSQFEGDNLIYPLFPAIQVSQGSLAFDNPNENLNLVRIPTEPNTVIADTLTDSPIIFSSTFILENYPSSAASYFDFNLPFAIRFNNLFSSGNLFTINVANYLESQYPTASLNLPINGYFGTNWFDPLASGEGIVMQIYEVASDPNNLTAAFAWSTFDTGQVPYWLFGQSTFARGARSMTATMAYRAGGGFAGSGGPAGPPQIWGTATFTFSDCNNMRMSYAVNPGVPASVPQGTGVRNWTPVASVNGLPCE